MEFKRAGYPVKSVPGVLLLVSRSDVYLMKTLSECKPTETVSSLHVKQRQDGFIQYTVYYSISLYYLTTLKLRYQPRLL
jgi:hypothetical protein